MPATATGRGAQVIIDPSSDTGRAIRGAYATTLDANTRKAFTDVLAGTLADGSGSDGTTRTGGRATDFVTSAGGVYITATAGSVALTGTTNETNLAALRIPGGLMGPNGMFQVHTLWGHTNSAGVKTMTFRYNATPGATTGGATGTPPTVTTTASSQFLFIVRNNNSVILQAMYASASQPYSSAGATPTSQNVNTAVDSYLNINGTLAVGTDTLTLVHAMLILFPTL